MGPLTSFAGSSLKLYQARLPLPGWTSVTCIFPVTFANLPSVKTLTLLDISTTTAAEARTDVDFIQQVPSSPELKSLGVCGWNANSTQLILDSTKAHANTKELVVNLAPSFYAGQTFPLGSLVDTLRRTENITDLVCEGVTTDTPSLVALLKAVPPSIRPIRWEWEAGGHFAGQSPTLERHISEALRVVNCSSTLVDVVARIESDTDDNLSIFSEQDRQTIHTIGLRNKHLPRMMCGSSVPLIPLGLRPQHLLYCASRSGHRDHLQLIAGAIRVLNQTRRLGKRIAATTESTEGKDGQHRQILQAKPTP